MGAFGEGRPDIQIARGTDAKGKGDIIKCDSQIFIDTAYLIEDVPSHEQARRRHRADVLSYRQPVEVTGVVMIGKAVGVAGEPVDTEHDAAMLDAPVRIDELCADATDRL